MSTVELRAELFREMNPLLDNDTALEKLLKYVKTLIPRKQSKDESNWADRFLGAWIDEREATEIVDDIRSARTANNFNIEL